MSGRLKSKERVSRKVDEEKKPKRDTSKTRTKKSLGKQSPTGTDWRTKSPSRTPKSPKKTPTRKPSKSPARKSPSRKSPARKSPPSKSPVRNSPTRKTRRSPLRRTPNRRASVNLHADVDVKKTFIKSTSTPIIDFDTDSDEPTYVARTAIPKISVRGRPSRKLNSNNKFQDNEDEEMNNKIFYSDITRRNIHLPVAHESESIGYLKETYIKLEQKLTEFSDDDLINSKKVKLIDSIESTSSRRSFVVEFGGWVGALFFIVSMPFEAIFLNTVCNEKKCSFSLPVILEPYKKFSTYFSLSAALGFTVYALLLAVLSSLPFGGQKVQGFFNKNGKLNYVMNGLYSAVVMHLIVIGLEVCKIPIITFICDKYFQLAVSSVILGILFAVCMYVHSFFVPISTLNPNGDTNSVIYNFFMGRELNPRLFGIVDAKMFLVRMVHVSMVVFISVLLCKSMGLNSTAFWEHLNWNSLKFRPTLLTISFLFYVYFLDALVYESTWIATFALQHDGVGYMTSVRYFAAASTYAVIPKYIMDFEIELCTWQLIVSVIQFLIGYILYRGSNNQKYMYRKNPYGPLVAHLETIPTSQGKKLIVSGFWGFVRHPNYLGDILIHLSFLYYVISVPPAMTCLLTLPILIHRSVRDGLCCKQKYEAGWDRYCQRVKYILIPKIY